MSGQMPLRKLLVRVIPAAFMVGVAMELFMIFVPVGSETFYDTAKRLENTRREERRQRDADLKRRVQERLVKQQEGNDEHNQGS